MNDEKKNVNRQTLIRFMLLLLLLIILQLLIIIIIINIITVVTYSPLSLENLFPTLYIM